MNVNIMHWLLIVLNFDKKKIQVLNYLPHLRDKPGGVHSAMHGTKKWTHQHYLVAGQLYAIPTYRKRRTCTYCILNYSSPTEDY
jgi:hypothetical protein